MDDLQLFDEGAGGFVGVKPELTAVCDHGNDTRLVQESQVVCVEDVYGVPEALDAGDDVSAPCQEDVDVVFERQLSIQEETQPSDVLGQCDAQRFVVQGGDNGRGGVVAAFP